MCESYNRSSSDRTKQPCQRSRLSDCSDAPTLYRRKVEEAVSIPIDYSGKSLKILALPRERRVLCIINGLEKGLGKSRCIQFQWVSGLPPKPSNSGTASTGLTSPMARGACLRRRPAQADPRNDLCNKRRKLMERWATYCCSPPAMAGKAVVALVLDDSR